MFAVLVCKNKEQHIFRACISWINHYDESCNDNLIIGKGERFFIAELGGWISVNGEENILIFPELSQWQVEEKWSWSAHLGSN